MSDPGIEQHTIMTLKAMEKTAVSLAIIVIIANIQIGACMSQYQQCNSPVGKPNQISEPQVLKIDASSASNEACELEFIAPVGKFVELEFIELDLGKLKNGYKPVNTCGAAFVRVSQPIDEHASYQIGYDICGQTDDLTPAQRVRRSASNIARLNFTNNAGKFQVQFTIVDDPGQMLCPRTMVELPASGAIRFPIQDDTSVLSFFCCWRIIASPGKRVKVTVKKMNIGLESDYRDHLCHTITVFICDGPDYTFPPMQEFCFNKVGRNVTELSSTGNKMQISFFSPYVNILGSQFELDFQEV